MLDETERTDEDDSLAPQVVKVDQKVKEAAGKQRPNPRIEVRQHSKQEKKVKCVEDAKANVGNGALDGLQFPEVAKHAGNAETALALNVQEVVVDVDQDSANGKKDKFSSAQDG